MKKAELKTTLKARGGKYGDFSGNGEIAQALKDVMHKAPGFEFLSPEKKEGLDLIATKISRVLTDGADPEYRDNWHDIAGYATIVEERCK